MPEFEILSWIALGFAGLVVVGWLCVTWMAPGPTRTMVEWFSATALFVTLFSYFLKLSRSQWEAGNTVLLVPFGFLTGIFGLGLMVSLGKSVGVLRGGSSRESSATH